jgi:ribosomal protein S18 acetylase RimI-like enzyme
MGAPAMDAPLPKLETGWLPTTPAEDTYQRRFLLNWAAMCAANARALGGRSAELPAVALADRGRPSAFTNCATLLQPLAAETAPVILADIAEFFAFDDPSRRREVLLASAWPTGDLRPWGWSLMGHPPLHLLPAGATPRPEPPELRIEEVDDLAGLRAWERVMIEGFPLENLLGAEPGAITSEAWLREPRARHWVGWVDGRAVAASAAWVEHGIANVTGVATLPDARRRGYGEALTWRAALADPSLPAMLFSSDDGRPVYDRMGFLPLWRLTLWHRDQPG